MVCFILTSSEFHHFSFFVFYCIFNLYYCNNEEVKIGNSSKLSKEVEEDEVEQSVF